MVIIKIPCYDLGGLNLGVILEETMKKITAMLLVVAMILTLTACSAKEMVDDAISSAKEEINSKVDETLQNLGQDIVNDFTEDVEQTVENAASDVADDVITNTVGHTPEYWTERFGTNYCPFTINVLGIELPYHFRNGGYLDYWVYTEENVSGWYINDGYVISADNAVAISIEDEGSFSSFCSYDALPYTGKTLSEEEQKAQKPGVFYTLNSYTPVNTNWGVLLWGDESNASTEDYPDYRVYNLTDSLKDQEWFKLFITVNEDEYIEHVKLWAFPHIDKSGYSEILTEEFCEKGILLGNFAYDSEENETLVYSYIPNEKAGGFEAGPVDLVLTVEDEGDEVTVGVMTVITLPAAE